ncbi:hypothetical protein WMY93_033129, partial [Mugilogobius chulae]
CLQDVFSSLLLRFLLMSVLVSPAGVFMMSSPHYSSFRSSDLSPPLLLVLYLL